MVLGSLGYTSRNSWVSDTPKVQGGKFSVSIARGLGLWKRLTSRRGRMGRAASASDLGHSDGGENEGRRWPRKGWLWEAFLGSVRLGPRPSFFRVFGGEGWTMRNTIAA